MYFSFSFLSRFLQVAMVATMALLAVCASAEKNKHKPAEYALLSGTVWNADATPAFGVTVKIRRTDEKKARWTVMSDHRGEFAQRVPAGTADYVLTAEVKSKGGKPVETTAHIENEERVDVGLHLTE